jgi:hypothetical protein
MDLLPQVKSEFIKEEIVTSCGPEINDLDSDSESEPPDKEQARAQLPTVEPKASIPEDDIFVLSGVKKKEKKILIIDSIKEPENSKGPDKPKKPKRVMSEQQLERLRVGREKGLAKRRALAIERKEIAELKNKKKKKDIQSLRDEVADKPIASPAPVVIKKRSFMEDISPEILIKLQQDAIEGYDTKRKERKALKKEVLRKKSEKDHFTSMVTNAVNPQQPARYGEPGFFNHLWS